MDKLLKWYLTELFFLLTLQVDAVSPAGKATVKWGEIKTRVLENGAKPSDSGELVMSEDEFAMAIMLKILLKRV